MARANGWRFGLALLWAASTRGAAQEGVSVVAAPRSFTVVTVPVPTRLPASQPVEFRVTPTSSGSVLGTLTGTLPPAVQPRAVVVTIGIPGRARAGDIAFASVRFSTVGQVIDVPIRVTVPAIRQIQITAAGSSGIVSTGSRYTVSYRLTNFGNAPDTLDVRIDTPDGWRTQDPAPRAAILLDSDSSADLRATFAIPAETNGSTSIRITALARGVPVATAEVPVDVLESSVTLRQAGPSLTVGSALARGPWGTTASAYTAQLDGMVTDRMAIAARVSTLGRSPGGSAYAFSRAGVINAPPSLQLSAPGFRMGLGIAGATCSDLCGVNIGGTGVSMTVDHANWGTTILAARPNVGLESARGEFEVVRVEARNEHASVSSAVTHLVEDGNESRRLDAVTLGAGLSDVLGGQWLGELARRRFDGGEALGWSSSYSRRSDASHLDIRYSYAPGGARTFARATSDLTASASRSLGRTLSLNGSAWSSADDGGATFQQLSLHGWSVGSHRVVTEKFGLSVTGHGSDFTARTVAGSFGNGERAIDAALDGRRGMLSFAATVSGARVTRSLSFDSATVLLQAAARAAMRGSVGLGGTLGTIALTGNVERTGPGIGLPPLQWSYGVRADHLALGGIGSTRLVARVDAQRFRGVVPGSQPTALAGNVSIAFPHGTTVEISAEQNPFIIAGSGPNHIMYVVRASRSTALPRLTRAEWRGLIFKDLNGNGARDAREPGLPGVVIHRGTEVATTDAGGCYTFTGESRGAMEIDARSLPMGWLAPSIAIAPGQRRVGILAVSTAEIRLRLSDADTVRVVSADLGKVVVVARDESGRTWVARRPTPGSAVFDALPPGTYALEVDASESGERLFVDGALPPLVISAGRSPEAIVITLRPRTIRMGPAHRASSPEPRVPSLELQGSSPE